MKKYKIGVWHTNYGIIEVEADSKRDAEIKAKELLEEKGDLVITDVFERDFGTAGVRY